MVLTFIRVRSSLKGVTVWSCAMDLNGKKIDARRKINKCFMLLQVSLI
jgi:hypothetical protein